MTTDLTIKFWGVQGSIPSPLNSLDVEAKVRGALEFLRDGGQLEMLLANSLSVEDAVSELPFHLRGTYKGGTTCIQVSTPNSPPIIIDAGSSMKSLGETLAKEDPITILLTHLHWDHIQGLPFFGPIYSRDAKIAIHSIDSSACLAALCKQQESPCFPADFRSLPANIEFQNLNGSMKIGEVEVAYLRLNHSDVLEQSTPTVVYRLTHKDQSIILATDIEPEAETLKELATFSQGATVLYCDSHYRQNEVVKGWGHFTPTGAVDLAVSAGIETVILGHHDPKHGAKELLDKLDEGELRVSELGRTTPKVLLAYPGMELTLTDQEQVRQPALLRGIFDRAYAILPKLRR